jgi:hypothetical protein
MADKWCSHCGHINPLTTVFRVECGQLLLAIALVPRAASRATRKDRPSANWRDDSQLLKVTA